MDKDTIYIDGLKIMFISLWKRAEAAERSANAWEADAQKYKGWRRAWRMEKAKHMREECERYMEISTG